MDWHHLGDVLVIIKSLFKHLRDDVDTLDISTITSGSIDVFDLESAYALCDSGGIFVGDLAVVNGVILLNCVEKYLSLL